MVIYLDRPRSGWFVLDVMRRQRESCDWVALMVDYDPDDPNRVGPPPVSKSALLRIPGTYMNRAAARDSVENMIATRH
jgi:hypothetical protein